MVESEQPVQESKDSSPIDSLKNNPSAITPTLLEHEKLRFEELLATVVQPIPLWKDFFRHFNLKFGMSMNQVGPLWRYYREKNGYIPKNYRTKEYKDKLRAIGKSKMDAALDKKDKLALPPDTYPSEPKHKELTKGLRADLDMDTWNMINRILRVGAAKDPSDLLRKAVLIYAGAAGIHEVLDEEIDNREQQSGGEEDDEGETMRRDRGSIHELTQLDNLVERKRARENDDEPMTRMFNRMMTIAEKQMMMNMMKGFFTSSGMGSQGSSEQQKSEIDKLIDAQQKKMMLEAFSGKSGNGNDVKDVMNYMDKRFMEQNMNLQNMQRNESTAQAHNQMQLEMEKLRQAQLLEERRMAREAETHVRQSELELQKERIRNDESFRMSLEKNFEGRMQELREHLMGINQPGRNIRELKEEIKSLKDVADALGNKPEESKVLDQMVGALPALAGAVQTWMQAREEAKTEREERAMQRQQLQLQQQAMMMQQQGRQANGHTVASQPTSHNPPPSEIVPMDFDNDVRSHMKPLKRELDDEPQDARYVDMGQYSP